MEFQLFDNSARFLPSKGFTKKQVCEYSIVEHHTDHLCFRITFIDKPFHLVREIDIATPFGYLNVSPTSLRFTMDEEVPRPIPFVFVVIAGRPSGSDWNRSPGL
ncbi:MAG: hypothetical protein IPG76_23150 [Acidobacteria bacterium]|nr:hypothetical protein [Acidobacteriota bacterium]